jgi:hypothetical protein
MQVSFSAPIGGCRVIQIRKRKRVAVFVYLISLFPGINVCAFQDKASKPSISETMKWMSAFTYTHGRAPFSKDNVVQRFNYLQADEGCTFTVNAGIRNVDSNTVIVSQTYSVSLAIVAPDRVTVEIDKSFTGDTYVVKFEVFDLSYKIKLQTDKNGDLYAAGEELYFDSEASAQRFSNALVHAATVCGGPHSSF